MANHKSAIKRQRQNDKRRVQNQRARAAVRTSFKGTVTAIRAGDFKLAAEALKKAERTMMQAASRGLYHKNNAQRKVSRLAGHLRRAQASS